MMRACIVAFTAWMIQMIASIIYDTIDTPLLFLIWVAILIVLFPGVLHNWTDWFDICFLVSLLFIYALKTLQFSGYY
jgi:hypothetical protein